MTATLPASPATLTINDEASLRLRISEAIRELTASGVEHLSEADAETYLADFVIGEVERHRSSPSAEWRGMLARFFEAVPEFDADLDETACPDGFVTCVVCGGGGHTDGRKKLPPEHKPGCVNAELRALISGVTLAASPPAPAHEGEPT